MTEPRRHWVAILGWKDTPTDGVADYCAFLAQALARHDVTMEQVRVAWAEKGWMRALRQLRRQHRDWDGSWVIFQYTALAWSGRGFPFLALAVTGVLRSEGCRVAVVFHEPHRQGASSRWIDRIRGECQDWVIRRLYAQAEKCIFADPLESIGWLPSDDKKSSCIPIGANIPACVSRDVVKTAAGGC